MEALMDSEKVAAITEHYRALSALVPLHAIHDESTYEQAVRVLNGLLDAGAADEHHPLAALAHHLGTLIGYYDDAHFPPPPVPPAATLRLLMAQHGLTQSDMQEVGTQGVVSEVLSGKREMNVRQIKALAKRFHVPPSVFLA